jgi:hypothetical protein
VSFPVNLFTIKGNLVFISNLYHKIAIASVCTALSFASGANEEAYSATFTFLPTITFEVQDRGSPNSSSPDYRGDAYYYTSYPSVETREKLHLRASYEFDISNLFLTTNTVIRRATVKAIINSVIRRFPVFLAIFGYGGNGMPDISDYEAGVYLDYVDGQTLSSSVVNILSFDVTPFVDQLVSNNNAFAGFTIHGSSYIASGVSLDATDNNSSLIIETDDGTEPVPEPTTIFGSAIALGLGGWLKRKKLSQQNKKAPPH